MRLLAPVAALLLASTALAASPPASAPVPLADLVARVDIPYQQFTLPNGLRVIVHTDRKAPVVAVSVWYHVGSKDEPAGQTGFAHLFEHLMFNGSENAPGDFFKPLQNIGATDYNGTTSFDRTNYFETVPTPALPLALFLESDRMGHLLGAIDQRTLDVQRGVVQNEKRQGDNEPYGLVEYAQLAAMSPPDNPYHHPTIGSMADLDRASLAQVKDWFRTRYGPNNAVLVLAGDVDVATAQAMVMKYFGDIPRGPDVTPAAATVPTLPARRDEVLKDQVATTRLYRSWYVPGTTDPAIVPLDIGASILGGLSSSRLDNALVRREKLAVGVTASLDDNERLSEFEVVVDVKPGVDPVMVGKRLDALIAQLIAEGPTADEVARAVTREVSGRIYALESVGGSGGKAVTLAEGALYAGDPGFYKKDLAAYAAATPAQVRAAMVKWLSRPVYALTVSPGKRAAYEEAAPADAPPPGNAATAEAKPAPGAGKVAPAQDPGKPARMPPAVDQVTDLAFPKVEHATLANGMPVTYARRTAVPVTRMTLAFDAGSAADPKATLGLQSLMLSLLDEGTPTRDSIGIAEEEERLGAGFGATATLDQTLLSLAALTPNLAPSLDLFADITENATFAPSELERVRGQQLAGIAAELTDPNSLAIRTLPPLLYGKAHPYGVPFTGTGDPMAVAKVTRADMLAFRAKWLRPDDARLFVVSDRPLAEILPLIDARFGRWRMAGEKGTKDLSAPVPPVTAQRILLIDRPDSPQSLILGGLVLPVNGRDDVIPLSVANDVLGGDFLSRMNMDLRETRHISYGVSTSVSQILGPMPMLVIAPVQADQTGVAIAALTDNMRTFLTRDGVSPEELTRTVQGRIRELPGSFETSADVLGGLRRNALFGRPDDYYDTLARRYRTLTAADLDKAARAAIDPDKLLWVIVGNAAAIRPQLAPLKLPVEVVKGQ